MRHSNVAEPSASENVKLAVVDATGPVGPESMVGTGGAIVSTVHERDAGTDALSNSSRERTSNVC